MAVRIAFFAETCIPIHAGSLEERPLGGTETGLIRLAEVLSARGHEVTVFTSMKNPPLSEPRYLTSKSVLASGRFDVMVLIQDWTPAVLGAPSDRIFYWTGDGWDQYANYGIGDKRAVRAVEKMLMVSKWQAESLCERSGFPLEKTHIIGNGVHYDYFAGEEQRIRKRIIYTAAPYRGLILVPDIYRELKKRHPDCELHLFAGLSIYDRERPFGGPLAAEYESLKKVLQTLPDCVIHDNVTQRELARELMRSSVFIYPNIIFETCCITAIEAQAAGCPVIASANSALPETVGDAGFVIPGDPGSSEYLRAFVDAADRLLSEDDLWQQMSENALRRTKEQFSWDHVADRFEEIL